MRLFLVRDELRTYWVAAINDWAARTTVQAFLREREYLTIEEAAEIFEDGVEVEECSEPPPLVEFWFNRRGDNHLGTLVYATQWVGEEIVLSPTLRALEWKRRDQEDNEAVAKRRRALKRAGRLARTNTHRRMAKKRRKKR